MAKDIKFYETIAPGSEIHVDVFLRWLKSAIAEIERRKNDSPSEFEGRQSLADWIEELRYI